MPGARILGVLGAAVLLATSVPAIASAATSVDSESASLPTAPLPPATAANRAEAAYDGGALVEGTTVPIVTVETAADGPRIVSHDVRSTAQARAVAASAAQGNDLLAVQQDTVVQPTGGAPTTDQYASKQWALDPTKTTFGNAWKVTLGKNVTVAVVDTGVQSSHPDLAGQVLPGRAFLRGHTSSSALNARVDGCGHGTHVAGTIAALKDNKKVGIAGAAPGVKILPVKVLNCSGFSSDVANGIKYAANKGAKVINLSLGGAGRDAGQEAAIAYARSKGAVVVAAAGNNRFHVTCNPRGNNATSYPGASPGVIGVASVDTGFGRSCFSNTGSYVDLAAPGSNILSTYPPAKTQVGFAPYMYMSGTSMATPHVAAAAALVLSKWPTCTPDRVEARLRNTARRLGGTVGRNANFGYGLVDPAKAVTTTAKTC